MATSYADIWNSILNQQGTQNIDLIASINEDGINNYFEAHHIIDNKVYHKEIKKIFNTQTDSREFTVTLDISSPIQVQFPPFKNQGISNEFKNKDKWYQLDSDSAGPQISALQNDTDKIQVYCNEVNISLTWPKLNPVPGDPDPIWQFSLKALKVFAEAFAILNNDQDGYYVSLIPTIVRFDVINPAALIKNLIEKTKELPPAETKLLDDCQEKFTDLFVIALNILATEQTPKLIRNIRIPVPVIKDRPILPSLLNISQNCLTVGAGIDKTKADRILQAAFEKEMLQFRASIDSDIENAGGLLQLISNNKKLPKEFSQLEIKPNAEIEQALIKTNEYIKSLKSRLSVLPKEAITKIKSPNVVDDAYAVGINQYFFQNIINSVIPAPKQDCSGWLDLAAVRGRACYWLKFFDPNIVINPDASLTGEIGIDIGGSIEACIRKFWDCSWSWDCGSLALSLKGKPNITIKLLKNNGINLYAEMGGNLYFDLNVPFPFNKIIDALTSIIGSAIIAILNILLGLLRFVVIYPELTIPQQLTKIKLKDFNSFYYVRPIIAGNGDLKNKFIGFNGGLISEK